MCEIMGMSLRQASQPEEYLKEFLCGGERFSYGWGIGLYPDSSAQIIKESTQASRLSWDRFLKYCKELNSKIFMGQLRNSTIGPKSRKNNHPFHRELNGREYMFVHNGTIYRFKDLETGQFKPIGDTDTEHIFCHLLHSIKKRGVEDWRRKDFQWLANKFRDINKEGTLNCVLSDGNYLFAYKSLIRENNLYFNPIQKYSNTTLDHLWTNKQGKTSLDHFWPGLKKISKIGMIISTRKLRGKPWYQLKEGELMVLKDGRIVYSNLMDFPRLMNIFK